MQFIDLLHEGERDVQLTGEGRRLEIGVDGAVKGIASGMRSAIVKEDENWIRLKGAFPGSLSEEAAKREIRMTRDIVNIFQEHEYFIANNPLQVFQHNSSGWCAVFETLGDRRLDCHVLRGVEEYVGIVLDSHCTTEGVLKKLGPLKERRIEGENRLSPTWYALMDDQPFIPSPSNLVDLDHTKAPELPAAYKNIWESSLHFRPTFDHILRFYERIGTESGFFLRELHNAGISWGFTRDSKGFHCNAHANNFVLLRYPIGVQLVAPLDFDLSKHEDEMTIDFKTWESKCLMMTLAGDSFISTGVRCIKEDVSPLHEIITTVLRDRLLGAFTKMYQSNIPLASNEVLNTEEVTSILSKALILTRNISS